MRSELVSSVDTLFSNLHFLIWIIEEMSTRLPLKDSQTTGKMLNNCPAAIVLYTKLLKTYLCSPAVYVYHWKKLLTSLSWDGWPSEGIAPVLKCSQLYPHMDKIFLVVSYNHFTCDKQETELNWSPKRGVTSVLYLSLGRPWSRMYLFDLTLPN